MAYSKRRQAGDRSAEQPLLVSVNQVPPCHAGMMDTILNLGLNSKPFRLSSDDPNERFGYDAYRRFISSRLCGAGNADEDFDQIFNRSGRNQRKGRHATDAAALKGHQRRSDL